MFMLCETNPKDGIWQIENECTYNMTFKLLKLHTMHIGADIVSRLQVKDFVIKRAFEFPSLFVSKYFNILEPWG
jgi:hypothetical protein